MWWDIAQGPIFFILGTIAAIFFIPRTIRRFQEKRERQLAKTLLRGWGGDCIAAMMRLKPVAAMIEIEGYGHSRGPGHYSVDLPIFLFWEDIREGKGDPGDSANIIHQAFQKVMFNNEERAMKAAPPDVKYPLYSGNLEVPKAMIKRILNPMYAKLDIFELELLPINELEMAMSYLNGISQSGFIRRYAFISYALHLAQSMEKFADYLWKLEGWHRKS